MLCGPVSMKDTSYEQPLWGDTTSNEDMMYKTWEVHGVQHEEQDNGWDQVKLRHSHSLEAESFPATRKSDEIENQDRFHYHQRTGLPSRSASNEDINTETEAAVRPRFQITIERPIRHITPAGNATFSQWSKPRTARRASDGFLASARYSGRNAPAFSALSEEHDMEEGETGSNPIASSNAISRASSLNCRRFSDGCFHSVPRYTGSKKVSIVLPQPRKSANEGSNACGVNGTTCDSDVKEMESADCSRNEEDDHWKELVAKAQGFKGAKMNGVSKFRGLYAEDVKGDINRSLEVEDVFSDISSEASFSSNSSYHSSSDSDSAVYSALITKPISGDLPHFREASQTISNTSRTVRRVSAEHSFDSYSSRNHPRRYSVASLSPARSFNPAATAKLSGYSTQSALEQARQLLSKLQLEGKNKNKKERLEELSRALKWILEELNRIETPDRDLVSLFISLRAKIVNLKSELKAEEFDATCIDPSEVDSAPRIQTNVCVLPGESGVHQQSGIRIYDGDKKTTFENGTLKLTTHRIIWDDLDQQDRAISVSLSLVSKVEEQSGGFMSSAKVIVTFHPPPANKEPGPCVSSPYACVKFSFKQGGHSEFFARLVEKINKKSWMQQATQSMSSGAAGKQLGRPRGVGGIVGIERKLEQKSKETDDYIQKAFKDLDALMEKAKEMVAIADKVASKLEEKKGSITEDETVTFKSYLLSMGIANPVTRETHGSGASYHKELAKELGTFLQKIIMDEGGMMTLTDVYCRFNRARGMELVSPDDLVNAAKMFSSVNMPLKLRAFDSGVLVIQSLSHSDEEVIRTTKQILDEKSSITAEELAHLAKVSVMLAKERLLVTEQAGKACRDDSVEGLRFYPNLFLERTE